MGCVSAIGMSCAENRDSLWQARSGVGNLDLFNPDGCHCRLAAQLDSVRLLEAATYDFPLSRHWSRAAQMVLVATGEAMRGAPGFVPEAVVFATTSGGMPLGEEFFSSVARGGDGQSAARRLRGYLPAVPVLDTLRVLGIEAPLRVVSNACASGTNAVGLGARMIRDGLVTRVLVGGYDALSQLVFSGFDSLQAMTPSLCRPFDAHRDGLVLGEGAAVLCLEAGFDGVQVSGYGAFTDTHHLTQPNPSGIGPASAMRLAIESAGCHAHCIGYVNAHGTATPQNDACEANALLQIVPDAPVSSTKPFTGHALGAAGAIEAVFTAMALTEGFLPPNLNFSSSDPGMDLDIVTGSGRKVPIRAAMSNSFGFGGANASLVLTQ